MKKKLLAAMAYSTPTNEIAKEPLRYDTGGIKEIALELLDESPQQLRIDVANIEELAASFESVGLIQPITLEMKAGGRYTIVAGHRRVEAARRIGWKSIKAIIVPSQSEGELAVKNLIENVQRDNLSPLELALAVDRAIAATGQKASEFAKTIGKSSDWLSKVRSILNLPQSVQDSLALELTPEERRRLGVEALAELSRLDDEELCVSLFEQLRSGAINRSGMRSAIKNFKKSKPASPEDVAHNEPQIGKIDVFLKKHSSAFAREFSFDFCISAGQKEAFLSEVADLCKKYSNMEEL